MSWQDIVPTIIRNLVNDTSSPYRYSDARLETLTVVSSIFTIQDVSFDVSYTIDVDAETITPDPSSDSAFIALTALRVACMIMTGEYTTASDKAIIIRDGPATIDPNRMVDAKKGLADTACKAYDMAKRNFIFSDGSICRAIVSPFRIYDDEGSIIS